jgi:hypothetical protein
MSSFMGSTMPFAVPGAEEVIADSATSGRAQREVGDRPSHPADVVI